MKDRAYPKRFTIFIGNFWHKLGMQVAIAKNHDFFLKNGLSCINPYIAYAFLLEEESINEKCTREVFNKNRKLFTEHIDSLFGQVALLRDCEIIYPFALDKSAQKRWNYILSLIKSSFPNIPARCFACLTPQESQLQLRYTLQAIHGNVPPHAQHPQMESIIEILDYETLVRDLYALFGEECVEAYGGSGLSRLELLTEQERLWELLGIDVPEDPATGLKVFTVDTGFSASRKLLEFVSSCNSLSNSRYPWWQSPWVTGMAKFEEETPYGPFNYETRLAIRARYVESNLRAAALLVKPRLFPLAKPYGDEKPQSRLTLHAAREYAEKLDDDFADAILGVAAGQSTQYRGGCDYICHRALLEKREKRAGTDRFVRRKPKVCVLTMAYNHAPFIEDNIKGVLHQQTDFAVEHIIADDCSTDGTQDIIMEYADKYQHITPCLLNKRHFGVASVLALFSAADSEYVAICDGDDFFSSPEKLQAQVDFLDNNKNHALCFHPVRVIYEDEPDRKRLFPPPDALPGGVRDTYLLEDLITFNFIQTNSVMYRWRFRKELPTWFRPDLMPGDWYWHLLHAELGSIGFLPKPMSVYRRHASSSFFLSEVDSVKHRHRVALRELATLDAIDKHFTGRFRNVIYDLAGGVIAECVQQATKIDDDSILNRISESHPEFMLFFLKKMRQ